MSRYKDTIVKIDKETGNRVYGVTLYPPIPVQDGDQFIYPTDGDRFENVAQRYYGDSTLWWIIAEANKLRNGGFALDPTVEIRVPGNIQPILQEFRKINEEFLNR
jgi:hypothetical protein|tara:strand:- start:470 stop:784 length:315 start_codon:yes stop_codon:yes gene_type:complete